MAVYGMEVFAYDFSLSNKESTVPVFLAAEREYFILLQYSLF